MPLKEVRSTRRGSMLLEAMVAGALLAVLLGITLRAFATAAVERRATEKRAIALVEATGAIERAGALEFDEITPERLDAIRLSPKIESILGEAKLNWTIETTTSQPPAKHIRAELAWQNPLPSAPLRLNTWVYQRSTKPPGGSP